MGWTERKTGFTDSVPPGISNMGFKAGQREDLGSLSTITTVMPHPDGNDALMKTFAEKFRKVIWTPRPDLPKGPGITVYQPPSEISYKDLTPKTRRYWGVAPTYNLAEVAASRAVCLPAPTRVLTDAEAKVFKMMAAKRRIFTFPGTNVTIFNSVLDQMDSIFEIIPLATVATIGSVGILPSGELMALPNIRRGWLRVRDKYSSLALATDAFGKGMAFENIISVFPTYAFEDHYGVYDTGNVWDVGTIQLTEDHYGNGSYGFVLSGLYPVGYLLDNWPGLSKAQVLAWLASIQSHMPYMDKTSEGYVLTKNDKGWANFEDYALFDWVSATMAYYTKDNILVAGFTPYWLTASYNTIYDTYFTTKQFSRWWAYEEWGITDQLHQYFYNVPQYVLYDDTYIPPVIG